MLSKCDLGNSNGGVIFIGKLIPWENYLNSGTLYHKLGKIILNLGRVMRRKNGNWRKAYCVINQSNFEHGLNLNAGQIKKKKKKGGGGHNG